MPAGEKLVSVLSLSTRERHVYRGDDSGDGGQLRRRAGAIRGELYVLTRSYAYKLLYRGERYKSLMKNRVDKGSGVSEHAASVRRGKNRGDKGTHDGIARDNGRWRLDTSY